MRIYPSGIICGIRIYKLVGHDAVTLFEKSSTNEMDCEDRKEVRTFYNTLSDTEKECLRFQIYIECSSPCEDDFMMWYPISSSVFKQIIYC